MLALLFVLWFVSFVLVMSISFRFLNVAFAIAIITNFVLALLLAVGVAIVYQSNKKSQTAQYEMSIDT